MNWYEKYCEWYRKTTDKEPPSKFWLVFGLIVLGGGAIICFIIYFEEILAFLGVALIGAIWGLVEILGGDNKTTKETKEEPQYKHTYRFYRRDGGGHDHQYFYTDEEAENWFNTFKGNYYKWDRFI